ncbi:DNA polymerase III subunit gamma/tau [Rhodovulum sp. DZ06]|uniref:DNA polymerase III subunit gamma/tau n=1 Tax=Rhodovulum sp. DZ06 TaxID=3425126 RepID=UPI003D359A61
MAEDSPKDDSPRQARPGGGAYQVLARKYRPADFHDLIGQEAMVRTLRNAFEGGRIAHAFVLTGVRGVGKTTTARIIAKGLNCIGEDGQGGPTVEPCGKCEPCVAISESRHVDVLEMDAASRTGVGDIRELIDGVRYRAASARYKVYIIDEVHMLSTSAFNALLKTLEEPPEHVKFIFATTEIRKVPVTVLSRCQRFDLRRIEPEVMIAHLSGICGKEGAEVDADALALVTRAAEGSVRDALSLLDQAIAHGAGATTAAQVRDMLGLADRGRVLDLFEAVMRGDCRAALEELSAQYASGADPLAVLRDLAEATHWISMVRIAPESADDPTVPPEERDRGRELAGKLGMRPLARMWQMLLKSMEEVGRAPNAMMAAEMAVIRLTHVSELPSPEDILRRLENSPPAPGPGGGGMHPGGGSGGGGGGGGHPAQGGPGPMGGGGALHGAVTAMALTPAQALARAAPETRTPLRVVAGGAPRAAEDEAEALDPEAAAALAALKSFDDVVGLIRAKRDARLLTDVERGLRLISYKPGRITFQPSDKAPKGLAAELSRRLMAWTGARWVVSVSQGAAAPTIAETRDAAAADVQASLKRHPLVAAALAAFPGAEIKATPELIETGPGGEAPEGADDPWDDWEPVDPFDDEPI